MTPKKKSKTFSVGGIIFVSIFFFAYHANKNQRESDSRQRAAETRNNFREEQKKRDEIQRLASGLQEKMDALRQIPDIQPLSVSRLPQNVQDTQDDIGRKYAAHQRGINKLPYDLGDGLIYVNCTFEEGKNVLIFHYILSSELENNVTQEGINTIIKQLKRTPDYNEMVSKGFSDIQMYWNTPTRLRKYSVTFERWVE